MTPTESLAQRRERQVAELDQLVTTGQDAIRAKVADVEIRLSVARRAGDPSAIAALEAVRAQLDADQATLIDSINRRQLAIEEMARAIAADEWHAALRQFHAHVKTLGDLAPECAAAVDAVIDVVGRIRGQLAGAATALSRHRYDQQAFHSIASGRRVNGDIAWHLARAFGEPHDPTPHGTVLDMQRDLEAFAAGLRP
jgi:hypothetical protein